MAPTTKAAAKATKAPAKTAKAPAKPAKRVGRPAGGAKKTASAKAAKPSAKKPAAKKATPKKAPAKKVATKEAPSKKKAPVKTSAVKKAAKVKSAPVKKAAKVKSAPVKSAPVKSAPVKSASRGTIPALAKRVPSDSDRKAPPRRTGPLDKFLLDQLADLQEERITYTRQAASLKAEADLLVAEREPGDVQFDEESGEGDTIAVERERDLALSASAQNAVEDIDRAIAKIHDGTYGICEQCYAKIPKERLRALPYAALCVQCKSAGFSRR